jgi:hypothetical protein
MSRVFMRGFYPPGFFLGKGKQKVNFDLAFLCKFYPAGFFYKKVNWFGFLVENGGLV